MPPPEAVRHPMEDFAELLVAARERLGLTQAQLAVSAGLTPSYVCLLENRKKPPPSDAVCERLAAALGLPPRDVLAVAHLQRSPTTVQQRVRALSGRLSRERRSRYRLLESMLTPLLVASPTSWLENAIEWIGGGAARRRRLKEVLAALGRRHQDQAEAVSRLVQDLPERDRRLLLESLPKLLSERDKRAMGTPRPPELFYSLPEPEGMPDRPFLLAWGAERGAGEVLQGDLLLVDPKLEARAGDLVVLRGADGTPVLRRVPSGERGPAEEPLSGEAARDMASGSPRDAKGGGPTEDRGLVVVEVRRSLRPRPGDAPMTGRA